MLLVLISFIGVLISLNLVKNGSTQGFVTAGWFLLGLNGVMLLINVMKL